MNDAKVIESWLLGSLSSDTKELEHLLKRSRDIDECSDSYTEVLFRILLCVNRGKGCTFDDSDMGVLHSIAFSEIQNMLHTRVRQLMNREQLKDIRDSITEASKKKVSKQRRRKSKKGK